MAERGGIARASTLLASGTFVSRILGFISGIVLAQTLGTHGSAANTFALANQLPNNIYAIIAGGILGAVFVPAIVRAGLHEDGGERYINRLVTLGILIFAAAAIAATFAAPALVQLYAQGGSDGRGLSDTDLALAVAFAYWCLPQVFFYALYSLLGEVLNARGVFGPFTWAPAVNNIVAIAGLVTFTLVFGTGAANGDWSTGMVVLVAGSATLGVAVQALVLGLFWRRAGLRYRPDFHFRGVGLGAAGKAASWTFGMILVTQVAGIVQSRVASIAAGPDSDDASLAVLRYAWLIFMLPHSIAAVSIATAYFTRMSTHARDGEMDEVRADVSSSLRSIGLILVFASTALLVVAFPFSALFASEGYDSVASMAFVVMAFVLGLVPFSILHVLRRTFYALEDTRTPFFVTVFQATLFIAGALLVALLPTAFIAAGIAAVTTIAGTAQTVLAAVLLRRRLGAFGARLVISRHLAFFGAALASATVGTILVFALGGFSPSGWALSGWFAATVTMGAAGVGMVAMYFGILLFARNPEAHAFIAPFTRRLRS